MKLIGGGTVKGPSNPLLKDALDACRGGFVVLALFSLCINLLMLTAPTRSTSR